MIYPATGETYYSQNTFVAHDALQVFPELDSEDMRGNTTS